MITAVEIMATNVKAEENKTKFTIEVLCTLLFVSAYEHIHLKIAVIYFFWIPLFVFYDNKKLDFQNPVINPV